MAGPERTPARIAALAEGSIGHQLWADLAMQPGDVTVVKTKYSAFIQGSSDIEQMLQPGPWTVARVYDLFPRVAERQRNYGNQLSGGEQQMLAIGRALVGNPKVILLDEPFEGLAPIIVDSLLAALRRIRNETQMAMMLIEQHAQLVLELLPEAIILDRGQVRWSGQSETLRRNTDQLAALIGL
jgi:ABC-type branched-subunit amino acid transport system ATPase component